MVERKTESETNIDDREEMSQTWHKMMEETSKN
jgi:hypothetical protein